MSKKDCIKCNTKIGIMANYGTDQNPLCFDCSKLSLNTNLKESNISLQNQTSSHAREIDQKQEIPPQYGKREFILLWIVWSIVIGALTLFISANLHSEAGQRFNDNNAFGVIANKAERDNATNDIVANVVIFTSMLSWIPSLLTFLPIKIVFDRKRRLLLSKQDALSPEQTEIKV